MAKVEVKGDVLDAEIDSKCSVDSDIESYQTRFIFPERFSAIVSAGVEAIELHFRGQALPTLESLDPNWPLDGHINVITVPGSRNYIYVETDMSKSCWRFKAHNF